jgi:hypothetical protein
MPALADFRSDLDNLLGTAVDSSTWTTAIKDESLRQAMADLNGHLVYETTFTVASSGHEQDFSSITDINELLTLAYPWADGWSFIEHICFNWRIIENNKIYFTLVEPQSGDEIRVRYTKLHEIENLDGAAATTLPDNLRRLITRGAAAHACTIRIRQLSENPAEPREAPGLLERLAKQWMDEFIDGITRAQSRRHVSWSGIGL